MPRLVFQLTRSLVLTLACGIAACAVAEPLRVGAASVVLEADNSMVISGGIGPHFAVGQEGQLRVVAVVLAQADQKVALVGCDVLFVTRELVEPALQRIAGSVGIPPDAVLVNASHTHHAPSTTSLHGYGRSELFCRRLTDGIAQAVETAALHVDGPARMYFAAEPERTVGQNSRLRLADGTIFWIGDSRDSLGPSGPLDPDLSLLSFRRTDTNDLLATVFNHSTHTIGTLSGDVRSPSFYGLAAQQLERELGGTVCFLQGASGSTHNLSLSTQECKRRIEHAVRKALGAARPVDVRTLRAARREFAYRIRTFDEATEDAKVVSYCRKRAPSAADAYIEVFRGMRKKLRPLQGKTRHTQIQAIVLGDTAIVGVPAEYFTVLGLDIKRRSPFPHTLVAELAGDWIGYLPDRDAFRLGGYQTWMGEHSYTEPGTGEQMADAVVALLGKLHGPRAPAAVGPAAQPAVNGAP